MLGIPVEKRPVFQKQLHAIELMIEEPSKAIFHITKFFQLYGLFKELIDQRRKDPEDDLITALAQAETDNDRFTHDELMAMLFFLLLAGHETTVNLIGNGVLGLLEFPHQLKKFCYVEDCL